MSRIKTAMRTVDLTRLDRSCYDNFDQSQNTYFCLSAECCENKKIMLRHLTFACGFGSGLGADGLPVRICGEYAQHMRQTHPKPFIYQVFAHTTGAFEGCDRCNRHACSYGRMYSEYHASINTLSQAPTYTRMCAGTDCRRLDSGSSRDAAARGCVYVLRDGLLSFGLHHGSAVRDCRDPRACRQGKHRRSNARTHTHTRERVRANTHSLWGREGRTDDGHYGFKRVSQSIFCVVGEYIFVSCTLVITTYSPFNRSR
jgi:hypothetical protein